MERILIGCMRFGNFSKEEMNGFIHKAAEAGEKTYDHADIYADGQSERIFGEAFASDASLKREDFYIQSKCGICKGYYDLSEKYIRTTSLLSLWLLLSLRQSSTKAVTRGC